MEVGFISNLHAVTSRVVIIGFSADNNGNRDNSQQSSAHGNSNIDSSIDSGIDSNGNSNRDGHGSSTSNRNNSYSASNSNAHCDKQHDNSSGEQQHNRLSAIGNALNEVTAGALYASLSNSICKADNAIVSVLGQQQFDRIAMLKLSSAMTKAEAYAAGMALINFLYTTPHGDVVVAFDQLADDLILDIILGMLFYGERFDHYKTKDKAKLCLNTLSFVVKNPQKCQQVMASSLTPLSQAMIWAKALICHPANVVTPQRFVDEIRAQFVNTGAIINVLDQEQLYKIGAHALLGVGVGSNNPPFLVSISWQGGQKDSAPIAFVGKGITFDSGGISIKPAAKMEEMKGDMAGAAVVCGIIKTLAASRAPVNAVGIVALAENMPSGSAQRPGDVVTSLSGQTIEVINTDAEGRLVLADALWYAQDAFSPRMIIDLATLTGAARVTFGDAYGALCSNNDDLANRLIAVGNDVGERLWRLPLDKKYDAQLNSNIADMRNVTDGYGAGTSIGAQFLYRFLRDKTTPWAHFDIAAVVATHTYKATPFGIRLLTAWLTREFLDR